MVAASTQPPDSVHGGPPSSGGRAHRARRAPARSGPRARPSTGSVLIWVLILMVIIYFTYLFALYWRWRYRLALGVCLAGIMVNYASGEVIKTWADDPAILKPVIPPKNIVIPNCS